MVGMLSDVGNIRLINEDFVDYYEDEEKRLYVIADGMGGHNAGEVASSLAVNTIISYIKNVNVIDNIDGLLVKAIEKANINVFNAAKENENLNGMGTTVTACLIKDSKMVMANIGDSSGYIIKDNNLIKITKDHSLVQQLIDNGSITEEEALVHPNKNIITRALGTNLIVEVDTFELELDGINKVVLCTDGLSNDVTKEEMYGIISSYDNKEACRELIKLSKEKGGRDNISVIIFEGEWKDDRHHAWK